MSGQQFCVPQGLLQVQGREAYGGNTHGGWGAVQHLLGQAGQDHGQPMQACVLVRDVRPVRGEDMSIVQEGYREH
jgi:hypothetical protein